jgi:pimeloyl-ACP methyl ester carboxylesterase
MVGLALIPLAPVCAAENSRFGQYAELPGVKLWFTDTGGTGTPIVLLHANTGTSASWEPQATAFAREGYRVIAFDRRGWGQSLADPATGAFGRRTPSPSYPPSRCRFLSWRPTPISSHRRR